MTSPMRNAGTVNPIQGFTPRLIKTVTTWNCAADDAVAFRVPASVTYQLNGTGAAGTLQAGAVTVIHRDVTSITFGSSTTIEVM
jgi:hypothetical protein